MSTPSRCTTCRKLMEYLGKSMEIPLAFEIRFATVCDNFLLACRCTFIVSENKVYESEISKKYPGAKQKKKHWMSVWFIYCASLSSVAHKITIINNFVDFAKTLRIDLDGRRIENILSSNVVRL